MKIFSILFAILFISSLQMAAQMHKLSVARMSLNEDSLMKVINNPSRDSGKVNAYHMMGAITAGTNAQLAIEYCKKGIVLGKEVGYPKGVASCMLNTSYCYGLLNNLNKAILYIDSSIIWYKEISRGNILAFCYRTRAEYRQKQGKLKQCLNDCDTAMLYAERNNSYSVRKFLYKIMAGVYSAQGEYDQSEMYYQKAYIEHAKIQDSIPMADILSKLGNVYNYKNEYDKSVAHFEKAISIAMLVKQENNLSEYYNNLSNVFIKKGDKRRAEINALKAVAFAKAKNNKLQLSEAQNTLSVIYLKNDSISAAITTATASFALNDNVESLETRQGSADALAQGYYKAGDFKKAFNYLQLSKILHDSMQREIYNSEVSSIQTNFKVKEKDKEIILLNKDKAIQLQEIQQQRLMIVGSAAIAILSLVGIWLFINRNRLRQKMKELELRNQIAADLHDEVGSSLSSIHMLSQMATQQGSEVTHKDILERMSSNAKETMDKMGDIVWMIKPGESEGAGLKQRMERFAYEICSSKNISLHMQLDELDNLKLSMEQKKNIYLIFKEAVNNAVKYSGTEKLDITSSIQNKELALQVKDFGKGFDSNVIKKGNGLDNMQNRAKELRGVLKTETAVNMGTTVQLVAPV